MAKKKKNEIFESPDIDLNEKVKKEGKKRGRKKK